MSVMITEDSELKLSYLYRNVWIKRLPLEKIPSLKKHKSYLQTAAVLTEDKSRRERIAGLLSLTGVVRITSGGNMSRTVCGEAHDGMYPLREYSRIVETEII